MKRFQKALLGVVVSGALLFSAQAAELSSAAQNTLQSAMIKAQQEIKDYGQVKTLGFTGENCEIILSNLNAKQYLVNLTADSTHKYGILDKATGKLVVPVEYDYYIALDGTETLVSQYDADHHPNYWFADETGKLTPMKLPSGYELATYEPNSNVFVLFKNAKKPVYDPYSGDGPTTQVEDVTFFALADKDMNIILDDIDMVPDWYADFFIAKTGSTKWERVGKAGADGNGTCGLFDPKTEKFVGKHDFNQIFWYDQHFIGTRSSGTKSYLLDGKGGETLLPANVKEYSSWAKTEVAAAGEHGLTESFSYPRLDITRENFTMLAMNLYNKIYPNKEIPALETKFTDCRDDPNVNNAAALGIITGYEDGTFKPNGNITRAEFATIAVRFFEATYEGENLFPDIDGHWAQDYINEAANAGIVDGYPDGTFGPQKLITRAEAMTMVNRTIDRHPHEDHLLADMIVWPDNPETAWYYEQVQEATNSHEYTMNTDDEQNPYEIWTELLPVRDWAQLEKEWSDAHSGQSGGDVV